MSGGSIISCRGVMHVWFKLTHLARCAVAEEKNADGSCHQTAAKKDCTETYPYPYGRATERRLPLHAGKARQGKARQGKERKGKARQGSRKVARSCATAERSPGRLRGAVSFVPRDAQRRLASLNPPSVCALRPNGHSTYPLSPPAAERSAPTACATGSTPTWVPSFPLRAHGRKREL